MWEFITERNFWLSVFPITFLSIGFWLLYFDRADKKVEPLKFLVLALLAGVGAAALFLWFSGMVDLTGFWVGVLTEEILKVLCAVVVMEIFRSRFHTVADGIMYGFAVGLGFAFTEELLYLAQTHQMTGFTDSFWLSFQGRFWMTTLLHGLTTALFGLCYAGAYLSPTLHKGKNESPLTALLVPTCSRQIWETFTLHIVRGHLLFGVRSSLRGHAARAVVLEGAWLAVIVHTVFNAALVYNHAEISLLVALGGIFLLSRRSRQLAG